MPKETAARKAERLLLAGKVRVLRSDRHRAEVLVRGDHARYTVIVDNGATACDCPAVGARPCSHRLAAALVAVAGLAQEAPAA